MYFRGQPTNLLTFLLFTYTIFIVATHLLWPGMEEMIAEEVQRFLEHLAPLAGQPPSEHLAPLAGRPPSKHLAPLSGRPTSEHLAPLTGQPLDVEDLLNLPILNTLCRITMGDRFEYSDSRLQGTGLFTMTKKLAPFDSPAPRPCPIPHLHRLNMELDLRSFYLGFMCTAVLIG
jgi:hypothetical protein